MPFYLMVIKIEYFTKHGLPLKGFGKEVICEQIATIIDKLFHAEVLPICIFTVPLFAEEPLF
jgi:hypothetical protein